MASEQLEEMITAMRSLTLVTGDIEADRAVMPAGGVPEGIDHEPVEIAGRDAAWFLTPGAHTDAALLYLHGGGYVMGGLASHGAFAERLSGAIGVAVLLLDYRLGPEHHHPAALDDALAAVRWLGDDRGISPERMVIAGDSAGGGLTLATLVALRDAGIRPAAGVMMSPWADLTCTNTSYVTRADEDPLVFGDPLRTYARAYAGDADLADPSLSPALGDLSGLPPLLVQVGGREILLDDSLAVAAAVEATGGEVTLRCWDEAIHVFQMFGVPESDEAIAEVVAFVGHHLA